MVWIALVVVVGLAVVAVSTIGRCGDQGLSKCKARRQPNVGRRQDLSTNVAETGSQPSVHHHYGHPDGRVRAIREVRAAGARNRSSTRLSACAMVGAILREAA